MSTYDFEPDPDDYGPEPPHIANPSTVKRSYLLKAVEVIKALEAQRDEALAEVDRLIVERDDARFHLRKLREHIQSDCV
jgi:uncharacterized coiled-coil DUF342 family protein